MTKKSKEIRKVPNLRFQGFAKEWEEKKFNSIYSFKKTNSYSRENLNYEKGEVKNIHYGDIHTKFNSLFDVDVEVIPFINDDIDTMSIDEDNYLKVGDLVIADASEDYNDIGKTIEIKNLNQEKLVAGLHTFLARKESNVIVNGFTSFLMKTYAIRIQIMKIAQGTKVLGISKRRLEKIKLAFPEIEEQNKLEINQVLSVSNSKGFILQSEQFDNHRVASKDVTNYKIVKKNDIAYNPSRINVGSIAILKDFETGIVSPMYVVFGLKDSLELSYFENLITTHLFNHLVKVGCSGSVRDSLNFEDLESFKLKFPCKQEQQKIAATLSAIDKKIALEEDYLYELMAQKKYLLQNMFI